jgi:hypothetical protein
MNILKWLTVTFEVASTLPFTPYKPFCEVEMAIYMYKACNEAYTKKIVNESCITVH